MYLRTIKVRSSNGTVNEYVRAVESYREDGKVKQRTLADLGRKDLLAQVLPKLRRLLGGDSDTQALTSSDNTFSRLRDAQDLSNNPDFICWGLKNQNFEKIFCRVLWFLSP